MEESVTEPVTESVTESVTETVVEPVTENLLWELLQKHSLNPTPNSNEPVVEQESDVIPLQVATIENESITYSIEPDNMTTESN